MGILKRLFGPPEPEPPPRGVLALAAPLARPAVHVVKSTGQTPSYLGGTPPLPGGMAWPSRDGTPLTFLACLDLASLHATLPVPWLPATGRLLFFYDAEKQPWGFDPKDRGSWAVMRAGDGPDVASPAAVTALARHAVTFTKIDSYPSWERPEVTALGLTDAEAEILIDASDAVFGKAPHHQVGGFPDPVQGDEMELECQLVSHGLYCGDSSGYLSRQAATLRDGAADWRLLLQVDSDDDLGVMWGDGGILYFWIREEDARAGRFDQAWVVLQCH
ncbi:MAG TPA: YwqG family protein [Vicinamibacterales bacterium]|nr:YwqG family protein [Vicinamibacterales bacterium]